MSIHRRLCPSGTAVMGGVVNSLASGQLPISYLSREMFAYGIWRDFYIILYKVAFPIFLLFKLHQHQLFHSN